MLVEPTDDEEFIMSVATHPRVWPRISESGQPPEQCQIDGKSIYLRYADYGVFSFRRITSIAWEQHVFMLPHTPNLDAAALDAVRWMFDAGSEKLVVNVPSYNWHAAALAKRIGYANEGRIKDVIRWRGRLYDFIVMGMTCPSSYQPQHL